jgi:hypothetical protein
MSPRAMVIVGFLNAPCALAVVAAHPGLACAFLVCGIAWFVAALLRVNR